jgi:putative Holliday junction resolvase
MRTLAIDLGLRRVGLALSDESGKFASPLEVLEVISPEQAIVLVAEAARKQDAARLVVGLPLNMDGTAGPAARNAVEWGKQLGSRCALPVIFVDERLSSFAADQSLNEQKRQGRKLTRKKKKQRQDALAAADFLQGFLEGRLAALDLSSIVF